MMKLVVGLGNPGLRYKNTRHNLGFEVIGSLAKQCSLKFEKSSRYKAYLAKGKGFILAEPQTYMNLSGLAVANMISGLDIDPKELMIVVDDINLDLGRLKVNFGGSDYGHNGLKSIIGELDSKDFCRLRLGVGRPDDDICLSDYVLSKFAIGQKPLLKGIIDQAVSCCQDWIAEDTNYIMNKYNKRDRDEECL